MKNLTILLIPILLATPVGAYDFRKDKYYVVDGDTLRVNGAYHRLLKYNAPEIRAKCIKENKLALQATEFLIKKVTDAKEVDLTDTGKLDKYGRHLSLLTIDGEPAASIMIKAGLAQSYLTARTKKRNWCLK